MLAFGILRIRNKLIGLLKNSLSMTNKHTHLFLVQTATLASIYALFAKIGLYAAMESSGGTVTLIWPPTGIAFAAVIYLGYKAWPGLALGGFIAGLPNGAEFIFAIGNPLPALIAVYLLRRYTTFDPSLTRRSDIAWFLFIPVVLTAVISATVGVTGLIFLTSFRQNLVASFGSRGGWECYYLHRYYSR